MGFFPSSLDSLQSMPLSETNGRTDARRTDGRGEKRSKVLSPSLSLSLSLSLYLLWALFGALSILHLILDLIHLSDDGYDKTLLVIRPLPRPRWRRIQPKDSRTTW